MCVLVTLFVQLIKRVYLPDCFIFLQVFLFLYLKKNHLGGWCAEGTPFVAWGEHSFQRESWVEIHGENLRVKGGAVPSSTFGQSAYLGAGWDGETVCTGGQMDSAPWIP